MHLSASKIYTDPQEDDYPNIVGFRDDAADYCLIFSRFSDLEPDDGLIEIVVRDQVNASTGNLTVELTRSQCRVRLDEAAAAKLLGVRDYTVDFQVDDATYALMADLLRIVFNDLPGLTIESDPS